MVNEMKMKEWVVICLQINITYGPKKLAVEVSGVKVLCCISGADTEAVKALQLEALRDRLREV